MVLRCGHEPSDENSGNPVGLHVVIVHKEIVLTGGVDIFSGFSEPCKELFVA